jgi:D-alanyl-lipoteichoic acid acyltransferase DltB (MBOAT superfamily)
MEFYSVEFAVFFIAFMLVLAALAKQKFQHIALVAASYFFYWTTSDIFLLILIFISLITFYAGDAIYRAENTLRRKTILCIATVASLSFLGFFKYYNFGIDNVNTLLAFLRIDSGFSSIAMVLPIGVSFYTFSGLSYIFDIYLGKLKPEQYFYKYALFISYFPHLLAGPIVRAGQFLPQLNNPFRFTPHGFKLGITLIAWGFFKKILIADNLAPIVSATYADPQGLPSITIISATVLFAVQVYCDFSGYIDIALGCAHIIGLHLPQNFNRPYFAKSVTQFWRRWNITLSSFIKDYLYIPLGGNRKGKLRTAINLIISMSLCGLWHGAAWNFVFWGTYNGILLAFEKMMHNRFSPGKTIDNLLETPRGFFLKILCTQGLFVVGMIMFRAQSTEDMLYCFQKFIFVDFIVTRLELVAVAALVLSAVIFFLLLGNKKFSGFVVGILQIDWISAVFSLKLSWWFIYLFSIIILLFMFSPSSSPEFIYFQF